MSPVGFDDDDERARDEMTRARNDCAHDDGEHIARDDVESARDGKKVALDNMECAGCDKNRARDETTT